MKPVKYGRKIYRFSHGISTLRSISITEKPGLGEKEKEFIERLLAEYHDREGTLEIVIKNGRPSHAIIVVQS